MSVLHNLCQGGLGRLPSVSEPGRSLTCLSQALPQSHTVKPRQRQPPGTAHLLTDTPLPSPKRGCRGLETVLCPQFTVFFHFRKCDVLNRGFSGYNTRWAKIILPRLVRKGSGLDSPVAVTIFFGANDSALKGTATCVSVVRLSLFSVTANLSFCTFFNCFHYLTGGSFAKLTVGSPSLLPVISSVFNVSQFYPRLHRGLSPWQNCSFWSLMLLDSIWPALSS